MFRQSAHWQFPWDRLLLAAFPPKTIGRGKRVIAGRRIESAFANDVQRVSHQELRLGIVGTQTDHVLSKLRGARQQQHFNRSNIL